MTPTSTPPPTRRNDTIIRRLILTLGPGLIALTILALVIACGPSAPVGQSEPETEATPTVTLPWLGTPPSESEIATVRARPTYTPYPPGYVKPTDLPTFTPEPPLPTLMAQLLQEEQALQTQEAQTRTASSATGGVVGAGASDLDRSLQLIAKQVDRGEYDAIARVRVVSARDVRVPKSINKPSDFEEARRHTVNVIATYRGTLPAQFDVVSYPTLLKDNLDPDQEYILAVYKFWIPESEYKSSEPWRAPFTPSQLEAAGGEAYSINTHLTWVVDGETARNVPGRYFSGRLPEYSSHLEAARGANWALPVKTLETALRADNGPP